MVSQAQARAHEEVARAFVESWNNGVDADIPTFLRQFSPSVVWHDHAFLMCHKGLDSLGPFRTSWLTAIKEFHCDIKSIRVVEDGAVIQCLYNGVNAGPLPSKPASGRRFAANVLIILGIDDDRKIQKVDEYYSKTFDEAQDVDNYAVSARSARGNL